MYQSPWEKWLGPLIHHDLFGRVLGGPLLLLPLCVGRVVVQVDQKDGDEGQHRVRDDEVVSKLHLRRLVPHFHLQLVGEVLYQFLCKVGRLYIHHEQNEDQEGQACCRGKRNERMGWNYVLNVISAIQQNADLELPYLCHLPLSELQT